MTIVQESSSQVAVRFNSIRFLIKLDDLNSPHRCGTINTPLKERYQLENGIVKAIECLNGRRKHVTFFSFEIHFTIIALKNENNAVKLEWYHSTKTVVKKMK